VSIQKTTAGAVLGILVLGAILTVAGTASAALTGAIYTTEVDANGDCTGVDINLYESKLDVYVDGGPRHVGNGTQLPDGDYYIQVTDPSGKSVLGSSVNNDASTESTTQTPVKVVDGSFEECYQLWAVVSYKQGSKTKQGYKDTPNNGGVYKVWISKSTTFENSTNKTDNFKVLENKDAEPAQITVRKFYDANNNGVWDDGEVEIDDWVVHMDYPSDYDDLDGDVFTPWSDFVPAPKNGTWAYTITERMPSESSCGFWAASTPTSVTIYVEAGGSYTVTFGNYCLKAADVTMSTKGFWHNKNGSEMVTSDDLAGLRALNLVDGNGNAFDPTESSFDEGEKLSDSPYDLSPWLVDGGSSDASHVRENFAQQLAAFYLNAQHYLGGGAAYFFYAPSIGNAGPDGEWISATDLIDLANEALGDGYDSYLHGLLDAANNDTVPVLGVAPEPCCFEF